MMHPQQHLNWRNLTIGMGTAAALVLFVSTSKTPDLTNIRRHLLSPQFSDPKTTALRTDQGADVRLGDYTLIHHGVTPKKFDPISVNVNERRGFKCCSNVAAGPNWSRRSTGAAWCPFTYTMDEEECRKFSFQEANEFCISKRGRGRLCTVHELEGKCATGNGCGFDLEYVWTGTSEGAGAVQQEPFSHYNAADSIMEDLRPLVGSPYASVDFGQVGVCSRESLDMLTSTMRTDRENALRPMSIPLKLEHAGETIHFDGLGINLVNRAFLNNARIALVGDSTLAHVRPWFVTLLMWMQETGQSMADMDASQARKIIIEFGKYHLSGFGAILSYMSGRSAHDWGSPKTGPVTPMGGDGAIFFERAELNIDKVVDDLVNFRPKIIVANVGLHLLHLWNFGKDRGNIESWLGYEDSLQEMVVVAETAGAEVLLLKTTNFVCIDKYVGDWAKGVRLYNEHDEETLDKCFSSYKKTFPETMVRDIDIMDYCKHAVIDERGSLGLNRRLHQFVESARGRHPSLKIAVFDDHDLETCETTAVEDGRHHHPINLARIRLLGNHLDCLYNWDGMVSTSH
eukprot:CAMPEP_0183716766 /NCGR_PEP_ID=MMETSP0737-20130205/10541_1 /TAXON_ID=385413 /ORGANISM="Thalassiosira miniscula, Strain CCMP1093" /LENGTH=569 /DNA_ID=CAMNT_0025946069 /DNA_START=12 /DNA_END=1721 /DNA_ORIENTATION=+